ncbi:putative choline kinase [Aspergillus alliaceus]|uniref:putative choline kinase n=1 Tax=Petromyces alliaceus TaxID=209559 RepID=UPI0012A63293|nr:kinase-like domain-containing protein [Aspergillus alliaceus]KAB8238353.1 kinase-like domain-containing protein [Aspergillus alliaceus]
MPSFTDHNGDSGPDIEGFQPIYGTGLSISSLHKVLHANGNGSLAIAPDAKKQHPALNRKATARPPHHPTAPLSSQSSAITESGSRDEQEMKNGEEDPQNTLFHQVLEWLQREKSKRKTPKAKAQAQTEGSGSDGDDENDEDAGNREGVVLERTVSHGYDNVFALDKLEKILIQYAASRGDGNGPVYPTRRSTRRRQVKGLRRGSASESDYLDGDSAAPSVDATLDNSKTLAYSGGGAEDESEDGANARRALDREAWLVFKTEIVRLAHTLQLKGWRKLPMELAGEVGVVRLSGALTNAVYVVTPPQNIPPPRAEDGSYSLVPRKPPPKLLLRIYGPQVDHLIDRENELQILRRLGRKNIGPRVLGTFNNGRFEEFFEARPLNPKELRDPGTMKQIAKRMRELHDGIDLLDNEREGGPMVFKNWDKWVDRCEQVTNWLDKEIQSKHNDIKAVAEPWRRRGFVCGVPWPMFRKAVDNYRNHLISSYGGMQEIKRQLVFAHNDTQYGNLLRMEPSSESPLLRPENKHKQLVVIDFEYASANTPGFEFANHFTEWCYNYHDPERSWACNNTGFPTLEQQHSFISAYLTHRPGLGVRSSPSITPLMRAGESANITTLAPLDLDAGPDADQQNLVDVERAQEDRMEAEIRSLIKQARLWRVFNSAQWVAWGIVQAKVPGMEEGIAADAAANGHQNGANGSESEGTPSTVSTPDADAEETDEFDYLAYAQDRALFFWADLLALNLVREEELPAAMVQHIKPRMIDY